MSDLTVNFRSEKKVWDAFAATSPQRSAFILSPFLDSLGVDYDLVTCSDRNRIVAGVVILRTADGGTRDSVHLFTEYQGMLLANDLGLQHHSRLTHGFKAVEYLLEQVIETYRGCCLCHSWRLEDIRPFQWVNYHEPAKGVFKIDLRYTASADLQQYDGFEKYLASIRSVRRQEYRKARSTLRWAFSTDENLLDLLHGKTLARQGIVRTAHESDLVRSIARRAFAGGYGKMICAMRGETPVAAVLFLYDDRTAYYLFGAGDPAYRNSFGGTLALVEMIKDSFMMGITEIDFVGANSPNRADYKISFNANLRPYFITTFCANPPSAPLVAG